MAGFTEVLRGKGKGPMTRDTRSAVKALVGLGAAIEDVEIEVKPGGCSIVRVKKVGKQQEEAAKAHEWDDVIGKPSTAVRSRI